MTTVSNTADSAEERKKRKALQLIEGQKAMLEYEANQRATREKTARLRALRLAHEKAQEESAAEMPPAKKKSKKVVVR